MIVSKKWLEQFLELPGVSDQELAARLMLSTVEVEKVIDQAAALASIVVGLVVSCQKHPNADRLRVCQVDVGGRQVQIVCGGTNVAEGMKVAVALPGAWVRWHGEGDPIELKETKIRGEASFGMICASVELGLNNPREGEHEILDLGNIDAAPGTPLASVLGRDDVLFEIEHKSLTNRPDLMGHYGMAREISALYGATLAPYDPPRIPASDGMALSAAIKDAQGCARYMAVAVEGIAIGPSPAWMRDLLTSCGIRPINNVVDVTNFVMLELGQPMHAFDARAVPGGEIRIRRATSGETLTALDGKTYKLDPEMLVIANREEPIAIAGVMGGSNSGILDGTTAVVFESANFDASSVRKTSMRLGLRSESSARFEKSLDSLQCDAALRRAIALLREMCPSARVVSTVVDEWGRRPTPVVVTLAEDAPQKLLGVAIPVMELGGILTRLGFKLEREGRGFSVTVPSWRATRDIAITEDVIEEIARIWGYDRIPADLPAFMITPPVQDPVRKLRDDLRGALSTRLCATETYNYAFVKPSMLETLGFDLSQHLKLANPLSAERPYLVRSLIPNLLENVEKNQRVVDGVCLYEIARVFFGEFQGDEDGAGGVLPQQPYHAAIAATGQGENAAFVRVRGIVEATLAGEGFDVSFGPSTSIGSWMHPSRAADILVGGKKFGVLAEVGEAAARALGLDQRTAVAELNLTELAKAPRTPRGYAPIPQFPSVKRDLAFVVEETLPFADVSAGFRGASSLLHGIALFDVYRGKGVGEGKKSLAVHLELRADDRTLSSEEADAEVGKFREVIEGKFGGTIRA
jgi:phenylalanyl-tRNA synthetase beta chain